MSTLELPVPFPQRSLTAWRLRARRLVRIGAWSVVAAVVVAWALLFRPQFLGGPAAYVMVSGVSMEPTLHTGDLVIAHRHGRYRVGDTVLYRVPHGETGAGSLIIHRIVGGSATSGWIVQGDNRDTPDLWRPKSTDVVGSRWVRVPGVGKLVARTLSPFGLALISTALALLLGLPGAVVGAVESRPRRRRSRSATLPSRIATALALARLLVRTPVSGHRTKPALLARSRALAVPLLMPALAIPASSPLADVAAVVSEPARLAPAAPSVEETKVKEPSESAPARSFAFSDPFSWGEAAWTAWDLHAAASAPRTGEPKTS